MVAKYCFRCHNSKNPLPAGLPLALDKADFADPGADALTWERVVKKLGVGAMPPQGVPHPGQAELAKFRAALIASLDAAAAKKNEPGKFVLHRLNRLEYANAVRDMLGVTIDVADLLPSDSGDFGFDNIASALPTSPLLLDRYLTAGLRIAEVAVGNDAVAWSALTQAIDRETETDRKKRLFLRADKTVPYGALMRIMDLLRGAGYLKVALVGLEGAGEAGDAAPPGVAPAAVGETK